MEHRKIVEDVLGKSLPSTVQIHHWDGNGFNNAHENLLVCPDQTYHMLIHKRMEAYDACGNANADRCKYCGEWGLGLRSQSRGTGRSLTYEHVECAREYRRNVYGKR